MITNNLNIFIYKSKLGIIALLLTSCSSGGAQQKRSATTTVDKKQKALLISPKQNTQLKNNEELKIVYSKPDFKYDSAVAYLDEKRLAALPDTSATLKVKSKVVGRKKLIVRYFYNNDEQASTSVNIIMMPQNAPKQHGYTVAGSYPHDERAYTQGLQIHDDTLYESTGQYGQSSIRKVDLKSGNILKIKHLNNRYFGEGICVLNNLIYQLTWQEQTCLVYDSKTLELQTTIPYVGEGWGLTTDGKYLIMSNGTNVISYLSPKDFTLHKRLEVYTDKGPVSQLNELELINGEIWANVYGSDFIVRIDTASGAVNSLINLEGLLPNSLKDRNTDVLNGIAYNKKTEQIFVTGKNWKRLFEVRIRD